MISKELLSAVYPIDETTETYVGIQESTGRVMWFGKEYNDCRSEIDIHRVANECKKWAYSKGYPFNVLYRYDYWDRCEPKYDIDLYNHRKSFADDMEYKAIFKASEWILEQIQNKKD